MEPTIFHKIVAHEAPADIVYEDDEVVAFRDIHPQAPTHLLFVPKTFVPSLADVTSETDYIPGMLIRKAKDFASKNGIAGYKLSYHVGKEGGQVVFYLHLHFLAQKKLERA